MRLIFIGPPGSGKGTQAKLLSQRLDLQHVATGDILREAIRNGTAEGQRAKPYLDAGQLVPDDLVNDIIGRRFLDDGPLDAFVMDGYPRTVDQAEAFDKILAEAGMNLDAVVFLRVDDHELIHRISGRWVCPNPRCKATYHTLYHRPRVSGVCDDCGTQLVQRDDDKEETVRKRLQVFHDLNNGLLAYYRERGLLVEVPGAGNIENIYRNIIAALPKKKVKKRLQAVRG